MTEEQIIDKYTWQEQFWFNYAQVEIIIAVSHPRILEYSAANTFNFPYFIDGKTDM